MATFNFQVTPLKAAEFDLLANDVLDFHDTVSNLPYELMVGGNPTTPQKVGVIKDIVTGMNRSEPVLIVEVTLDSNGDVVGYMLGRRRGNVGVILFNCFKRLQGGFTYLSTDTFHADMIEFFKSRGVDRIRDKFFKDSPAFTSRHNYYQASSLYTGVGVREVEITDGVWDATIDAVFV